MLLWELVGAAVGAGFASGKEIASFFARYGRWGYAGIIASGAMMMLSYEPMPDRWRKRWPEKLWKSLLSIILITTGGTMMAGAGEIWRNILPLKWSSCIGHIVSFCFCWLLAAKTKDGLAWMSRILFCFFTVILIVSFCQPQSKGVMVSEYEPMAAIVSGVTHGGFNAALQWPMIANVHVPLLQRKAAVRKAAMFLMAVMTAGLALMLRHPNLIGESMPFMIMIRGVGRTGYYAFALCLYLAVLSTLTACMKAVKCSLMPISGMILISCVGFQDAVSGIYPVLGAVSALILLTAKMVNSAAGPFLSRKDML